MSSRKSIGYGAYGNAGPISHVPLPPPVCPACGQRHPHFIHGSAGGHRGAGRSTISIPQPQFVMHMTPSELESMIYGPMFKKMMEDRGIPCPAKNGWEHPPSMPGHFVDREGLGQSEEKKTASIWVLLGILAVAGLLLTSKG